MSQPNPSPLTFSLHSLPFFFLFIPLSLRLRQFVLLFLSYLCRSSGWMRAVTLGTWGSRRFAATPATGWGCFRAAVILMCSQTRLPGVILKNQTIGQKTIIVVNRHVCGCVITNNKQLNLSISIFIYLSSRTLCLSVLHWNN